MRHMKHDDTIDGRSEMGTEQGQRRSRDRDGDKHMCDLWVCERCECINYRDINIGRLL